MKHLSIALAGIAALAAGATAEAQRGRMGGAAMTYVMKAGASDMYEIESSRLAAQRAERPEVREMAQRLIADHTRSTEMVMAAARADGVIAPPPRLKPRQRSMIRQLERARGRMFDRMYLSQQIPAHREALTLHRNYARMGRGDDLRRAASGIVPVVEGHLAHARRLQRGR